MGRWATAVALVGASVLTAACGLLPFFEDAPCAPLSEERRPCGLCDAGQALMRCSETSVWEPVDGPDGQCSDNPYDGDGDGRPNDLCRVGAGACCGGEPDCDDSDPSRWTGNADLDGDGYDSISCGGDDCDDQDPERWSGNADLDGDEHDSISCGGDDCDDQDPERWSGNADLDGDEHDSISCGGDDCDDQDPERWSGNADLDGDLHLAATCCAPGEVCDDCDDLDPERWSGNADLDGDGHVAESCGGDDCNDEDVYRWTGHADLDGDWHVDARCGGDDCDDRCADCAPGEPQQCGYFRDHDCDGLADDLTGCNPCTPGEMRLVATFPETGFSRAVVFDGEAAFVAAATGLYRVEPDTGDVHGPVDTGDSYDVTISRRTSLVGLPELWVASTRGLHNVSWLTGESPYVLQEHLTGDSRCVFAANDVVFVAGVSGLFAVGGLGGSEVRSAIYGLSVARSLFVWRNSAIISVGEFISETGRLATVDVSDATDLQVLELSSTIGPVIEDLFVAGDRLYGAVGESGIGLWNLPWRASDLWPDRESDVPARSVFHWGDHVYVAGETGLFALNSGTLALASGLAETGAAQDVFVSGGRAYVATANGLAVVELDCTTAE